VGAVKFSPDGRVIASASVDGWISLRDVGTGRLLQAPWKAHSDAILSLAFDPDGTTLASAGDTPVKLWKLGSASKHPTPEAFRLPNKVYGVAINQKRTLLAVACSDGTIVIPDLERGTIKVLQHSLRAKDGSHSPVYWVAFVPRTALLASAGEDGRIVFWKAATGKEDGKVIDTQQDALSMAVLSMAVSHDGKTIVSGHPDGSVYLWNIPDAQKDRNYPSPTRRVWCCIQPRRPATGGCKLGPNR